MKIHPKRAAATAAAIVMGAGAVMAGGVARADEDVYASSYENSAYSDATVSHNNVFHVSFRIERASDDEVAAYNEAVATSTHCKGCRSVAIAFQIILDDEKATHVHATNHGYAVNEDCAGCQTVGIAYQFVVSDPAGLTAEDRATLYGVNLRLHELELSTAPADQIASQAQAMAGQVSDVLKNAAHGQRPLMYSDINDH